MGMERACHLDGTDRNAESRAVVKSASTLVEHGINLPLDAFLLVILSPYWLTVVNLRAGINARQFGSYRRYIVCVLIWNMVQEVHNGNIRSLLRSHDAGVNNISEQENENF